MDETQALEISRHAPTLLGGLAAGSQGAVKVWAPDRRLAFKMLRRAGFGAGFAGIMIYLIAHTSFRYLLYCFWPKAALGLFIPALRGVHRPVYITTDDAGIGVTQWRGSRSIRWDEIGACAVTQFRIDLHTFSRQRISIHLVGHTERASGALAALIVARAGLGSLLQRWRVGGDGSIARCYSRSEWRVVQDGCWPLAARLSFYEWSNPEAQRALQGRTISRIGGALAPPDPHRASLRRTLAKRGRGS